MVEHRDAAPWRLVREPLGNLGPWPRVAATLRGYRRPLVPARGHLEAAWAAVVLVEGDRMTAAPDDDRRLPSITVRSLEDVAREPFDLPRLQAADAVLLASSVSLLVSACAPA